MKSKSLLLLSIVLIGFFYIIILSCNSKPTGKEFIGDWKYKTEYRTEKWKIEKQDKSFIITTSFNDRFMLQRGNDTYMGVLTPEGNINCNDFTIFYNKEKDEIFCDDKYYQRVK